MATEEPEEQPDYCTVCNEPLSGAEAFCAGCGAPTHAHDEEPHAREQKDAED